MRDPSAFRSSIDRIERVTGIDFLAGLDEDRESFGGSNFDHVVVLRGLIMSRCLTSLESDHVFRID